MSTAPNPDRPAAYAAEARKASEAPGGAGAAPAAKRRHVSPPGPPPSPTSPAAAAALATARPAWLDEEFAYLRAKEAEEPLLTADDSERPLLPIPKDREWIWDRYKQMRSLNSWQASDVDMSRDAADYERLPPAEQNTLDLVLAFFLHADVLVAANCDNFVERVRFVEAKFFFREQASNEQVHAESYAIQVLAIMKSEDRRQRVLGALQRFPSVRAKRQWARRWMAADVPYAVLAVIFVCFEGLLFQSSFAIIQSYRNRNILDGLVTYNEYISRDEGFHAGTGAGVLIRVLRTRPSGRLVLEIVKEAVELEKAFVDEAIGGARIPGVSLGAMKTYIEFVADGVLADMGCPAHYRATNPFPFMRDLRMNRSLKPNFFEVEATSYHAHVGEGDAEFGIDSDDGY